MRRNSLIIVAVTALLMLVGCGSGGDDSALQDFTLKGYSGGRFYLSDHRGAVVVAVFWSVHCVPCHKELGDLKKHPIVREPGVKVISVCVDPEDRERVAHGAEISGPGIPVFLDSNRKLARRLGITTEPVTLIIDPEGREHSRITGYDDATLNLIQRNVGIAKQGLAR